MSDKSLNAQLQELSENYFTTTEAVDYVRSRHPGMHFSPRQVSRAIADGNLPAMKIGRLLFIPRDEMERYADNLMESHKQPGKLRLRPSSLRG